MIIKLSSSRKAVQVVDEEGRVFQTSVAYLVRLLEEPNPGKFALLTELPFRVSASRFPKSPLYEGVTKVNLPTLSVNPDKTNKDVYAAKSREKLKEDRAVEDSEVDW